MENFNKLTRIILIGLVIIAVILQLRVILLINNNMEKLDADPLVYGAQKFNINDCSCIINENTDIWFNQSISIMKYERKANNITLFR